MTIEEQVTGGVKKMGYVLGVDLGTTYTAAATWDPADGQVQMLGLGNRSLQIPSVLYRQPDGTFLVGEAAERRGAVDPGNVVREFKRRIGDHVPILVGGVPYSPQALTARLLRWVVSLATERVGAPPDSVTLTHPANWRDFKIDLLLQAAALADVDSVTTCSEPEAAARQFAATNTVHDGDRICVYDLGGGTFDAAVLARTPAGFQTIGTPDGIEHLGGIDFDEAVFRRVLDDLPDAVRELDFSAPTEMAELARLRRDCTDAKEALSTDVDTALSVGLGPYRTSVRLTRSEFEDMIRPALQETIGATNRALRSANTSPGELSAVVLVGGSSRIPLVTETLTAAFRRPVALNTHPKHDIALGAALTTINPSVTVPLQTPPTPASAPLLQERAQNGEPTEIIDVRGSIGPTDQALPPTRPTGGTARRNRILLITGAAVVVVALAVGAIFAFDRNGSGSATTGSTEDSATPSTPTVASAAPVPIDVPQSAALAETTIVAPRVIDGNQRLAQIDALTGAVSPYPDIPGGNVPAVSPDRRTIIYLTADEQKNTVLQVMAADGSGNRRLFATPPPGCERMLRPGWNPADSNEIVAACYNADKSKYTLNVFGLDGTFRRTLPVGQDIVDDPSWSPDGQSIIYWAGPKSPLGGGSIYSIASDGQSPPVKLTDGGIGSDVDAMYSPDGASIVFRRMNFDAQGVKTDTDIAIMNADGSNLRVLAKGPGADRDPAFSPDGATIVWTSNRPTVDGGPVGQDRYWLMDLDGEHIRRLDADDTAVESSAPAWASR